MKYLIGILLSFVTAMAFGQSTDKPLVQFSGITRNTDTTHSVVPYVNITNVSTQKQVYISNFQGYFSFVAHEQDTLRFSSVGYAPVTVIIPAHIKNQSLVMTVLLKPQIINLPMVRVFPWATTDEFKKDFLAMKFPDDDIEIARKNLNPAYIHAAEAALPNYGYGGINVQEMHNGVVNSHSITNPLLNPFAWGSLIKDIAAGDKSGSGR